MWERVKMISGEHGTEGLNILTRSLLKRFKCYLSLHMFFDTFTHNCGLIFVLVLKIKTRIRLEDSVGWSEVTHPYHSWFGLHSISFESD